jgi:hypothetical protein
MTALYVLSISWLAVPPPRLVAGRLQRVLVLDSEPAPEQFGAHLVHIVSMARVIDHVGEFAWVVAQIEQQLLLRVREAVLEVMGADRLP